MSPGHAAKAKLVSDVLCQCVQHSRAAEQLPEPRRRAVVEESVARCTAAGIVDLNGLWTALLREPGVTERNLAAPFAVLEDLQGVMQVQMAPLQRLQALNPTQRQALVAECTVNRTEVERIVRQARIEAQLAGAKRPGPLEGYANPGAPPSLSASPPLRSLAAVTASIPGLSSQPAQAPLIAHAPATMPLQSAPAIPLQATPAPLSLQLAPSIPLQSAPTTMPLQSMPPIPLQSAPTTMPLQSMPAIPLRSAPATMPLQPLPALRSVPPLAGPTAPSGELLALGLTIADICHRLGPRDAEGMLRRLADLIRDNGVQLAAAAAALPPPPLVSAPVGRGSSPALPLLGGLGSEPGLSTSPFAAGRSSPGGDDEIAKEARARAARALLDSVQGGSSADSYSSKLPGRPRTASISAVSKATGEKSSRRERLKIGGAALALLGALASLAYVLQGDSAATIDLSSVSALQLGDGKRIEDTVQATIQDPKWAKLSPDAKKEAAGRVFQELRAKGVHTVSLMNAQNLPAAMMSDKDPSAPGAVSVVVMGALPPGASATSGRGPAPAAAAKGP